VLLLLVALVGFHIRQSEAAGTLGIVGFIAAFIGTGLLVSMMGTLTFDASTLAVEAPALLDQEEELPGTLGFGFLLSGICAGVGWALFSGATFRARIFRRAAAVILTIGALLIIAPRYPSGAIALRSEERVPSTGQVGAGAQPRVQ